MTEEEAKTMPCIAPCPYNVGKAEEQPDGTIIYRCIASACMAWRWEDDDVYEERLASWEDAANIGGLQRGPEPARRGHCGLAGKP